MLADDGAEKSPRNGGRKPISSIHGGQVNSRVLLVNRNETGQDLDDLYSCLVRQRLCDSGPGL